MKYILGIDIGGTKLHLRARLEEGKDLNLSVPSKSHFELSGASVIVKEITAGVKDIRRRIGRKGQCAGVAIGLSGLNSPSDHRAMLRALSKVSWWKDVNADRRLLVNDVMISFRCGTDSSSGISLVSGTGSNGFAVDAKGREAWVGGRGSLIAGEGSGYDIGVSALRAVRRAEDGRGRKTQLLKDILGKYRVKDTAELQIKLRKKGYLKREIASINTIVEKAAYDGDVVSRKILKNAADELVLMVATLHKKVHFGKGAVDVVVSGGVIHNNKYLQNEFLKRTRKMKWVNLIFPSNKPVEGALKMLEDLENN